MDESRRGGHRIRRTLGWIGGILLIYLVVGNTLHHGVFRMPPPDPATYPRPGDEFGSVWEGFHIRVTGESNGYLAMELEIAPGAVGPPRHYHRGFPEEFVVREGTLHIELADGVVTVGPGERHLVEPYTVHRPFNPGSERVVVATEDPFIPQYFAACLAQIYPLLDAGNGPSAALILQMSVMDPICDTHLADVPGPVLAGMNLVLAPVARILGYRNYDPERALHRTATTSWESGTGEWR